MTRASSTSCTVVYFFDKISLADVKIYISFYVEASNGDAFMAVKQVRVTVWYGRAV